MRPAAPAATPARHAVCAGTRRAAAGSPSRSHPACRPAGTPNPTARTPAVSLERGHVPRQTPLTAANPPPQPSHRRGERSSPARACGPTPRRPHRARPAASSRQAFSAGHAPSTRVTLFAVILAAGSYLRVLRPRRAVRPEPVTPTLHAPTIRIRGRRQRPGHHRVPRPDRTTDPLPRHRHPPTRRTDHRNRHRRSAGHRSHHGPDPTPPPLTNASPTLRFD